MLLITTVTPLPNDVRQSSVKLFVIMFKLQMSLHAWLVVYVEK